MALQNTTLSSVNSTYLSETSSVSAIITTTARTTTASKLTEPSFARSCPRIGVKAGIRNPNLVLSTNDTRAGTVVRVTCKDSSHLIGSQYMRCDALGVWNASDPACNVASWIGLNTSHQILIAVFTGCSALILFVVCIICCRLLHKNKKGNSDPDRDNRPLNPRQTNDNVDQDKNTENHYYPHDVTRLQNAKPDVTYARPEVYSSFINPSFYEDAYTRWRHQEQTRNENAYDSPWQYSRRLKEQMDNPDFKWSTLSLRAIDTFDYDTYSRIPRGHISADSVQEDRDSMDGQSLTTF